MWKSSFKIYADKVKGHFKRLYSISTLKMSCNHGLGESAGHRELSDVTDNELPLKYNTS